MPRASNADAREATGGVSATVTPTTVEPDVAMETQLFAATMASTVEGIRPLTHRDTGAKVSGRRRTEAFQRTRTSSSERGGSGVVPLLSFSRVQVAAYGRTRLASRPLKPESKSESRASAYDRKASVTSCQVATRKRRVRQSFVGGTPALGTNALVGNADAELSASSAPAMNFTASSCDIHPRIRPIESAVWLDTGFNSFVAVLVDRDASAMVRRAHPRSASDMPRPLATNRPRTSPRDLAASDVVRGPNDNNTARRQHAAPARFTFFGPSTGTGRLKDRGRTASPQRP